MVLESVAMVICSYENYALKTSKEIVCDIVKCEVTSQKKKIGRYFQHGNYIISFWVKKFNVKGCLCAGKNQVDHETLRRNCEGNVNYRSSITYV